MNIGYPYRVEADENGGFCIQFVDFENAFTEGDSLEEAKFNAEEVLSLVLSCMLDDNEEIPEPSICPEGCFIATPELRIQAALLLRKAQGNKSEFRTLKQLDKAAKTLGKKLVLSLE
jgi:antitoxin HicB